MNDTEDEARYPQKPYSLNRQKHHSYSHPPKNRYQYEEEEEEDEDEEVEVDDYIEEENDDDSDPNGYLHKFKGSANFERYPKRPKLRYAVSGYQFAPRSVKLSSDWTEHEAFVLLEVWGDRFLQLGRMSLRSEDWVEVAEKVTEALKVEKTEEQCRRIMDSLKRKYKKEKVKVEQMGVNASKWAFFKKMDMLMDMGNECGGLACGVDSGEYVFMDTRVYLDKSNGFDEMRDSPNDSEIEDDDDEEEEVEDNNERSSASIRMLADSVTKFGVIYEKIESSKRERMEELERMRIDFQMKLDSQKKQMLEKTQVEIAKIREADNDDNDDNDEDTDDYGDSMETLSD